MPGPSDRALVIGASIAGLLAARALTEHYAEVVLLDRDDLPYGPVARVGVPQSRHSHALLARGSQIVEELFPGVTDQLLARGAATGDVQETVRMYAGPRPAAPGSCGLQALALSRPLLEWTLRERVAALPGVVFHDRTSVLDLAFNADQSTVTGVVVGGLDGPHSRGGGRVLEADLVVDASGRASRTPEWLERRGFQPPQEERIRVDYTSATRHFRRRPVDDTAGVLAIAAGAVPGNPRGGILLHHEDDLWAVSLSGYAGTRPPTDLAAFRAYARTLCTTAIADVVDRLEPVDDGVTYRFPADVRHRYERLAQFPNGLLVIGDALCAFDPSFGQGMSVTAAEAVELRDALRDGRRYLAQRYFAGAAVHVDTPWTVVVGAGAAAAGLDVGGNLAQRLVRGYVAAVRQAAPDDAVVSGAFLRVAHLVDPPANLLVPGLAARVARSAARRHLAGLPASGLGHGVTSEPFAGQRRAATDLRTAGVRLDSTTHHPPK